MTQFSLAELFGITIRESADDGSDFTNPSADYRRLFLGEDGTLKTKNSAGTVATVGGSSSSELDYVQITTGVTLSGTTEGTANTIITGTSQAYAAVATLIQVYSPRLTVGASATAVILLYDGATVLGRIGLASTSSAIREFNGLYRFTPTAATHQYIVKGYSVTNTSVFDCGAGGAGTELPAFIRITRA